MAMTPRERMLTAYRRGMPDRVPVSPELWDATAIAVSGGPWHELAGPFAQVPWWQTHLRAFEYFDCDAWIVVALGESPQQKEMRRTHSRFIDPDTIETEITYRTPQGELRATARTTNVYADWLIGHPVKHFPQDMESYADYYLTDPAACDLQEIREALRGVGEKGLVTPMVGELFTSFLGTVREGGMVQTVYDIQDYPDYVKRMQARYIENAIERTRLILENTAAQAIFVNSNYSGPPIVSPRIYREWDKPVLQAVAKVCRRYDVPLHLHQHGHLLTIIEDIIEAGVSLVCPLLPPPQGDVRDLAEVKRRFGERIALKGNVDPVEVLLKGTPDDVQSAVKSCLQAAAAGGSYILGTADSTVIGTSFENIHAFVEAGKKHGQYP